MQWLKTRLTSNQTLGPTCTLASQKNKSWCALPSNNITFWQFLASAISLTSVSLTLWLNLFSFFECGNSSRKSFMRCRPLWVIVLDAKTSVRDLFVHLVRLAKGSPLTSKPSSDLRVAGTSGSFASIYYY